MKSYNFTSWSLMLSTLLKVTISNSVCSALAFNPTSLSNRQAIASRTLSSINKYRSTSFILHSSDTTTPETSNNDEEMKDYEVPEDAVIQIKPPAMNRLRELKTKQSPDETLVLRMGVRNGGCSGLSYVMDFSTEEAIEEEDVVDEYEIEGIKCVVDAKSMLYLYGLELDYSDELIGGGFKFFNPNAEESCGCGSSFGV